MVSSTQSRVSESSRHGSTDRPGSADRPGSTDQRGSAGQPGPANQRLGSEGESLAAEYLERRGHCILARNWRSRQGELDLITRDGDSIVAVEVKTRRNDACGNPLEAVTAFKSRRLRRLLLEWVRAESPACSELRVDVIGITLRPGDRPRIDHLRGIS